MYDHNPIFIIGAPRSGTTFLASLLTHTDYGAPFETQFFIKYYKKLDSYGDLSKIENFELLTRAILNERVMRQWDLDIDPTALYSELEGNHNYVSLINALCLKMSNSEGNRYWGDKTPFYVLDLEIIVELFPNAKFVYIVRDGRDVALSLLKKEWGPNNIYSCAKYWQDCNSQDALITKLHNRGQLLQLSYERLLDHIKPCAEELYQFLNVPYDESTLDKVSSYVHPGNYEKWRNKMTNNQLVTFESVAGETLERYGYKLSSSKHERSLPGYKHLLYKLHNTTLFCLHLFKLNVIDGIRIKYFGKEPFSD